MIEWVSAVCAPDLSPSVRVRREHGGAAAPPADTGPAGEFTVVLAKSGGEFLVEEGMTILETLLQNGISQNYSCTQGVCGTCRTPVLEGVPDHRDWVLSDDQKASNDVMLICCSLRKKIGRASVGERGCQEV